MLSLGTMDEEHVMISALSRTGPRAVPDTKNPLPALAAALLGMAILFGVALAGGDTIHNAAHDTRHAAAFPCH